MGFKIVINTTRVNPAVNTEEPLPVLKEIVHRALERERLPFDAIETAGKPIALYYVDDRAIRFQDWEQTLKQVVIFEKARGKVFK